MHVILVAPHFPANQRRFAQALKHAGARVTGVGEASWDQLDGELRSWLDGWEQVSNVCDAGALEGAVRRIQARGPWVHRLEATVEAHMLAAAQVRERTGIPGLSSLSVLRCRDKFEMKRFLMAHGIPCAAQGAVDTGNDARSFAQSNGFPFILKPRDGAGAQGTVKVHNGVELENAIAERGLDSGRGNWTAEDYIDGHEGFFDTLTVDGEIVFEAISHYYPNVLQAMRHRGVNPYLVTTNRLDSPGYQELRRMGRRVIDALGIRHSATHMEWFASTKGLVFNEIGARPPGVGVWDIYSASARWDLYQAWGEAMAQGRVASRPGRRGCAGMVAIRPDRDGVIAGYSGVDALHARYGAHILKAHLPPPGTHTQPVDAGYKANAWLTVVHDDYDVCKGVLADIAATLKVHAR